MIYKKIWIDFKSTKKHAHKHVEMHGWFLLGFIPLYIVENRMIG